MTAEQLYEANKIVSEIEKLQKRLKELQLKEYLKDGFKFENVIRGELEITIRMSHFRSNDKTTIITIPITPEMSKHLLRTHINVIIGKIHHSQTILSKI